MNFDNLELPHCDPYPNQHGNCDLAATSGSRHPHLSAPLALPGLRNLAASAQRAAEDEKRYEQVQYAKFKSVEQGMDYDAFQNMVRGAHLAPVNLSTQPLFSIADAGMQQQRRGMLAKEVGVDSGEQLAMPDSQTQGQVGAGRTNLAAPAPAAPAAPAAFTMRAILDTDRAERAKNLSYQPQQRVSAPPSAFARVAGMQANAAAVAASQGTAAPLMLLGAGVRTLHDLEREWRGRPAPEQAAVLLGVPAQALPGIFDVAVGFDSLAALVSVLGLVAAPAHPGSVIAAQPPAAAQLHAYRVAQALARSPRIELAASFLEDETRAEVRSLCSALRAGLADMAALAAQAAEAPESAEAATEPAKRAASRSAPRGGVAASYPMMLPGWDVAELGVFASGAVRDEPGAGGPGEAEADVVMGAGGPDKSRGKVKGKGGKGKKSRRSAVDEAGIRAVEEAFGL